MRWADEDLRAAVAAGVLDAATADRLAAFLAARRPSTTAPPAAGVAPKFDAAHLLWYAGALIVIGAMGLFSTLAFTRMGGGALTVTAVVYAVLFTAAGHHLWHRRGLRVPGGLLVGIAVSMAPLAMYGIQESLGWWAGFDGPGTVRDFYLWIKGGWLPMEIAAIAAAIAALRFYRFPLLVALIAVALWFLSMDVVEWITARDEYDWALRRKLSVWFGLAILVVAWIVDHSPRDGDFAFWLHLFGLTIFWGGVSATSSDSELARAAYALLNVGLLGLSIILMRRAYAVFGALGLCGYLAHLAGTVFEDSLLFPFALSLIGVAVIALGLIYHRRQAAIAAWLAAHLPDWVTRLRPWHARVGAV